MNIIKTGGSLKLLAFSLVAVIVSLTVTVAVNGWQPPSSEGTHEEESDKNSDSQKDDSGGDENEIEEEEDVVDLTPKFYHHLTGLECKEIDTLCIPYAFVIDSKSSSYGLSHSQIVVEIPVEDGLTRFLAITSDIDSLGKIGSFDPTRDYISDVSYLFGANLFSYGRDDLFEYPILHSAKDTDLYLYQDSYYKEGTRYIFTNKNMIRDLQESLKLKTTESNLENIFDFTAHGNRVKGIVGANSVYLPFSAVNLTELKYDTSTSTYFMYKDKSLKTDPLTATSAGFDNVFVLFADSLTYERAEGVQTVIETVFGGSGYYATGGKAIEIMWSVEDGRLVFKNLDGESLKINRGTSYIGYFKSSMTDSVIIK